MTCTRQAVLATTALACCLGGLPRAANAQKAVGAVTQPQLSGEAARAQAAEAAASRYQTAVTSRPPGFNDDVTRGYPTGSTWLFGGVTYVSQIGTAGAAQWLPAPTPILPLDQIGLHVNTLALAAAGAGYAVGEVVTVTGGTTVTVATITGGASTGPIGTVTLTNPAYHACFNGTAGGLAQRSSSGAGTGATFTATFVGPYALGARLMTVCYKANKAFDLQFGNTIATIGFLPSGLPDYATADALFAGLRPGVVTAYDQGINGVNGVETLVKAGTLSPLRAPHGIRSLVSDGDINGPLDSGALNNVTALDFPAALSINNQANTLIWVGGVQSADHATGMINVGGQAGNTSTNLGMKQNSSTPNMYAASGGTSAVVCPGMPYDRDNIVFVVNTTAGTQCILNGVASAVGGGAPAAATDTTANFGYGYGGVGYAYVDHEAGIIVPWSMSAAEIAAEVSSLANAFQAPPQVRSIIIADGDSDTDGHGSPAQHEWPRTLMEQLGRPDIQLLDTAFYGSTMGGGANNGVPSRITEEPLNVLPALDQAYAAGAPNRWVVVGPMGYNDLNRGDSVATVEAAYTAYCDAVHAHHGLCALLVVPNRASQTGGIFTNLATVNAWIMASTPTSNAHADLPILSPGCPASLVCQQSDGIHETQINGWGQAQAVAAALAPLLQ